MLSYGTYTAIFYGSLCGLVIVGFVILYMLPLRRLAILLEAVFHFEKVQDVDDGSIVINVCKDHFALSKTVANRTPFIIALGMCLLVIILVFIEGCIFSTRHIYSKKLCSERIPNCYLFKTRYTSITPFYQFVCEADQPVISANVTANHAVCYGFVFPEQSSIDILNQLGVCTGILSLVDSIYPLGYKVARRKRGRTALLALVIVLFIVMVLILTNELNISFITIILLTLAEVLLGTILFLHYRKSKHLVGSAALSNSELDVQSR